jgi:hypothetical protein
MELSRSLDYKIERALGDGLVALGAYLDSEGAYDDTMFVSVCRAAEEHGLEHNVVRWIHAMPSCRQILTA